MKNFNQFSQPKTAEFKDVTDVNDYLASQHNVFEKYGVDKFLTDYGLVVNRDYRQRGVAGEFLKARVAVAKALGLKVTSSAFTAIGSQKAAMKVGYKVITSISFAEIGKVFPNFNFANAPTDSAKILDCTV
jgi:GNAT superfamily N-acetyltransferase